MVVGRGKRGRRDREAPMGRQEWRDVEWRDLTRNLGLTHKSDFIDGALHFC